MIKNIDVKLKQNIKDSIKETKNKKKTLFEVEEKDIEKTEMNIEEALKYYYSLSLKEQKALEEIFLEECSIETKAPINLLLQLKENSREFYNLTIGEYLLKALKKPKKRIEINNENWLDYYNKLDEYEKLKVEEEAIQLCIGEGLGTIEILLRMKEKNFELYIGTLKGYIIDILKRSM